MVARCQDPLCELAELRRRLDLYRVLRSTDGLHGAPWCSRLYRQADALLAELGEPVLHADQAAVIITTQRPLDEA